MHLVRILIFQNKLVYIFGLELNEQVCGSIRQIRIELGPFPLLFVHIRLVKEKIPFSDVTKLKLSSSFT